MRQLIRRYWYQTYMSRIFALSIAAAAAAALFLALSIWEMARYETVGSDIPGEYLEIVALIAAVVCGLSAEGEYQRGGVRNVVTVGHTRTSMFWASYIVNTLVVYAAAGVYLAIVVGACNTLGRLTDPQETASNLIAGLPAVAAYTAMFTLVGTAWPYKGTTVVNLVLLLILLLVANSLFNALQQEELYSPIIYRYVEGIGEIESTGTPIPNPHYVTEPVRSVYGFFNNALPTGQTIQLATNEVEPGLALYSAGFCAVCWTAGLMVLKRRDLQ